jgi:hypothetical protein
VTIEVKESPDLEGKRILSRGIGRQRRAPRLSFSVGHGCHVQQRRLAATCSSAPRQPHAAALLSYWPAASICLRSMPASASASSKRLDHQVLRIAVPALAESAAHAEDDDLVLFSGRHGVLR